MAVFRVEKNSGYTVMSNHHLRNRALSLKAKGLLSQMLSLPEDWDYTLQGLARINRESIDAIRQAIRELEQAGYIQRSRERDEKGRLRGADYVIFELPQPVPASVSPTLENPTLENPTQENPTLENPMQLNKDKLITEKQKKEGLNTDSIPIHSPNPLPLDEDEAEAPPPERTGSRKETAYQIYRDLILENIEYDTLTQNPRIDREQLDEIVDILLETVCTNRKSIRVAGDDYPAELVKAKFLKLDSHHIEFVMDCLRDNTTKVRNIKQYLRAMLFNAPSTINSYYASLVAHDMAQPDWGRPPNTWPKGVPIHENTLPAAAGGSTLAAALNFLQQGGIHIAGRSHPENHCPVHENGQAHRPSAASRPEKILAAPGQGAKAAPRQAKPETAESPRRGPDQH